MIDERGDWVEHDTCDLPDWMREVVQELRTATAKPFRCEQGGDECTFVVTDPARVVEIVFEIERVAETQAGWERRYLDYLHRGVNELYILEPSRQHVTGFIRRGERLGTAYFPGRHVSPYFGVQFRYSTTGAFAAYLPPYIVYGANWVRYHGTASCEVIGSGVGT